MGIYLSIYDRANHSYAQLFVCLGCVIVIMKLVACVSVIYGAAFYGS